MGKISTSIPSLIPWNRNVEYSGRGNAIKRVRLSLVLLVLSADPGVYSQSEVEFSDVLIIIADSDSLHFSEAQVKGKC